MQQLEIEFFWPLTEQIPLDLNYEGCDIRKPIYEYRKSEAEPPSPPQTEAGLL